MGFLYSICASGRTSLGGCQRARENFPLPLGNSVPLIGLESGNLFPLALEDGFPMSGKFMGNFPESNCFTFGTPIASVEWYGSIGLRTAGMAQSAQTPMASLRNWRSRYAHFALGSALICLLVAAVYYQVLVKLVIDWWQIPDFSHGFLVPPFAAYLIWEKRKTLLATKVAPSWSGIAVMALGLVVLLLGVYGSELFLSRFSLIILLAGLVLCFGGRQFLKELRFALLVLLLAIPIPAILFSQITFPLQILASKLASGLLPLFGVPVLREGNVIDLPLMKLEVAEACSGIRSLMSLFTLAVFYGYFMEKSTWRRVALVLASIPIAIAANAVRILGTGLCVQFWDPDKALGFFHEFSGWVIFLVSLVCLYVVHCTMNLFPAKRRQI